jgi:hypothetical protein
MKTKLLGVLTGLLLLSFPYSARAFSVDVAFTVTGTPGNWIYDFSVTNNIGGTNRIYFFDVALPQTFIAGSPDGFNNYSGSLVPFSPIGFGGSSQVYNNPWCVGTCDGSGGILPGQTMSGFQVLDTSALPLELVPFVAFAFGGTYTGPDCFYCGTNPAFENIAPTPIPGALVLFASGGGLLGLIGWRRKRRVEQTGS